MQKELPKELSLELGLDEPDDEAALAERVGRKLGVRADELPPITVAKRSIDARRGRVRFVVLVSLERGIDPAAVGGAPLRAVGAPEVVVVGDGPAGLFCAYQLAREGIGCVVLDRGKPVQPRRRDLRGLNQQGVVDPDSNYCFGEGGAGTFSDGKLYTRAHKRGNVRDVMEILALARRAGARS